MPGAGALDHVHELCVAKGLIGDSWHELSGTKHELDEALRRKPDRLRARAFVHDSWQKRR